MSTPSAAAPTLVQLPTGPASVVDEGSGPAVVLVHGLPGSARDFRWLTPHLVAAGLRAVRVELPGFGGTPVGTGPDPSPEGRAAVVLEVMAALGLGPAVVLGHSMVGVVATAVAAATPVAGVALISSPGLRPHRALRRFPSRWVPLVVGGRVREALSLPLVRRWFASAGFRGYPDAALLRTLLAVAATDLDAHAARVRALTAPTLVAWCEDDPLIEAEIFAELAATCPAGPRLRWPTGGHNPQKAYAAEIAAALAGWGLDGWRPADGPLTAAG
jgi:pimeloyl-ACP methyl ester carboxylesterase